MGYQHDIYIYIFMYIHHILKHHFPIHEASIFSLCPIPLRLRRWLPLNFGSASSRQAMPMSVVDLVRLLVVEGETPGDVSMVGFMGLLTQKNAGFMRSNPEKCWFHGSQKNDGLEYGISIHSFSCREYHLS